MSRANETGRRGEQAVREFLESKGAAILEQNYRIYGGEIDIIAVIDDIIAFVEVKTRKPEAAVSGFEAVTPKKQKFIMRTAMQYCNEHIIDLQPRFDVAEVCMTGGRVLDIDYLENAFDMSGSDSIF